MIDGREHLGLSASAAVRRVVDAARLACARVSVLGVLVVGVVVLQALLPTLHGMHHAAHAQLRDAACHAVATSGVTLDDCADSHASHAMRADAHDDQAPADRPDDCDECRTMLLAKALGGILEAPALLHTGEMVQVLGARPPPSVMPDPSTTPRESRGPPNC